MNIGEVSEWISISKSSIRNYLDEFGEIDNAFSEAATPEKGHHRRFTTRDVSVLYWITEQYDAGLNTNEIKLALERRLEEKKPFELPPRSEEESTAMIPRQDHELILAEIRQSLAVAQEKLDDYKERETERTSEINELNIRIGLLKGEIARLGGNPNYDMEIMDHITRSETPSTKNSSPSNKE